MASKSRAIKAVANINNIEKVTEMLASYSIAFCKSNNIPFEDFLDIYFGHFEKFMKQAEKK